jgi:hypothetical protein
MADQSQVSFFGVIVDAATGAETDRIGPEKTSSEYDLDHLVALGDPGGRSIVPCSRGASEPRCGPPGCARRTVSTGWPLFGLPGDGRFIGR